MLCQLDQHMSLTLPIALPLGFCGLLIILSLAAFACFYKKIFRELEVRRCTRLKGRYGLHLCSPFVHAAAQSNVLT